MSKDNYDFAKIKVTAVQRVSDICSAINKGDTDKLEKLLCKPIYYSTDDFPVTKWYKKISDTVLWYRDLRFELEYISRSDKTVVFCTKEIANGDDFKEYLVSDVWLYGKPEELFKCFDRGLYKDMLDKWIDTWIDTL